MKAIGATGIVFVSLLVVSPAAAERNDGLDEALLEVLTGTNDPGEEPGGPTVESIHESVCENTALVLLNGVSETIEEEELQVWYIDNCGGE